MLEKDMEVKMKAKVQKVEKTIKKAIKQASLRGMNTITFWPAHIRDQPSDNDPEQEFFSMILILLTMDTKNEIQSFS